MPALPPAFLQRMQSQLGPDYPAFLACYERPPQAGLRVNTLKLSGTDLRARLAFMLEPVDWCPSGFRLGAREEVRPGKHPYHAAGLYYLQEPSAMGPAELLAPRPGERILDLAASPGGKTTQLACLMQDEGLLWANEIRSKRIPPLATNLERWGVRNAVISNEPPERLSDRLAGFFDAVLVDAPCSGEGMFRRDESARLEWDAGQIPSYAARQRMILQFAAKLVRPGGRLVYSTCTFAPEENEAVIADFLSIHADFRPGDARLPGWTAAGPGSLRLWPHLAGGEGHFTARLERLGDGRPDGEPSDRPAPGRSSLAGLQAFCDDFLPGLAGELTRLNIQPRRDQLHIQPLEMPPAAGLRIQQSGLWLGTVRKDRFEPSHALALALRREDFSLSLDLAAQDPQLPAYLRGATLASSGPDGWLAVCVDGFPLGWGKRVQGVVKNHYPSGLRWL